MNVTSQAMIKNSLAPSAPARMEQVKSAAVEGYTGLQHILKTVKANAAEEAFLSTSERAVLNATDRINELVSGANLELEYCIHKETKTIMIRIINKETNEIIKEIPPEKTLDAFMSRMKILGLYVDDRG